MRKRSERVDPFSFGGSEKHPVFSTEHPHFKNTLRGTFNFLQGNCWAGKEKKPGPAPPQPSWSTIRWTTSDNEDHHLEFFHGEEHTVVLRHCFQSEVKVFLGMNLSLPSLPPSDANVAICISQTTFTSTHSPS